MESDKFARVLRQKLRDRMNEFADTICEVPMSLEDYRKAQGMIAGLAIAERELLDLSKAARDEIDDPLS